MMIVGGELLRSPCLKNTCVSSAPKYKPLEDNRETVRARQLYQDPQPASQAILSTKVPDLPEARLQGVCDYSKVRGL